MRRAMVDTVDEVGRAVAAAGIDCDFVQGGTVALRPLGRAASAPAAPRWTRRRATASTRSNGGARSVSSAAGATGGGVRPGLRQAAPRQARAGPRARRRGAAGCASRSGPRSPAVAPGRVETDARRRHRDRIVVAVEGYGAIPRADASPHPAALLAHDRDRAAGRRPSGTRSASRTARPSATTATCSSTASAPPTTASPSAGAAPATTGAAPSAPGYDRADGVFAHLRRTLGELFPASRRRGGDPPLGRAARRPARLARRRPLRRGDRHRAAPAATSATGSRPPTSPAAPSPTC